MNSHEIAQRLAAVRERIEAAARRSGRLPQAVRLVLASKMQPAAALRAAYESGAREFGENYVQEALGKEQELADLTDIRWHLIGHLQTNKARLAAVKFHLIQSLDSVRLAEALERARGKALSENAAAAGRAAVLVEINLGGELSKSGIPPHDAESLITAAAVHVEVRGLMAIPPPGPDPEHSRPYFAQMRKLRDRLADATGVALSELSMGMTDDFEVAIEEGATIVRVGRAVFGERPR
jgi:PLP dependent protein